MAILQLGILTTVVFSGILSTFLNPGHYRFNLNRLEVCDEESEWNTSVHFENLTILEQQDTSAKFRLVYSIVNPIQINFRLSLHGILCEGPHDYTCTHKFIRAFGYICRKIHKKNTLWYDFVPDSVVCPTATGRYDMGVVTLYLNTLSDLPLEKGYWVLKAYGYCGKQVIMCIYSEIEIYVDYDSF